VKELAARSRQRTGGQLIFLPQTISPRSHCRAARPAVIVLEVPLK
jgi:hypothetical protein